MAFKIHYVKNDVEFSGQDTTTYFIDIVFSIILILCSLLIIVAYGFLLHKFLVLIKSNDGSLDFMKF